MRLSKTFLDLENCLVLNSSLCLSETQSNSDVIQGWCSDKSDRLPPVWPGFDFGQVYLFIYFIFFFSIILQRTMFTKMNVWVSYFYWSGGYPKGPIDGKCTNSDSPSKFKVLKSKQLLSLKHKPNWF